MARRPTHLALVVLAVLVATSPSALVLGDAGEATAADSGVAAAVGPLDGTDDLTDDETTDANLTDENTTDGTLNDDETEENETVGDETTDATAEDADETTTAEPPANESDGTVTDLDADGTDSTAEADDADATTELEDRASAVTNEAENATSVTDGTDPDDAVETIDDAAGGATDAKPGYVSLDAAAWSSSTLDALDVEDASLGDASLEEVDVDDAESDDDGSASGVQGDSDPAAERDDRTENETTTAAGTGDAESPASGADSDGSPDRDRPGAPPSGVEAVAGVGALTAAALFPQFADGLALVGNVGGLSAASSAVANSRSSTDLRGELDRVWRFATAFRYSRYDDSDPLAHETRATLHETVERSPGAYLSAVCERADVAVSTARHHLDVLEDEGLVTTAKVRGKRRYFPGHSDDVELAAALEDEEAAEVLRALARLGDSHGGRLADELDRDPSTASHHLARLEDAGLVEREREGQAVVNRLAPEVRAVLAAEGDEAADVAGETPAIAD